MLALVIMPFGQAYSMMFDDEDYDGIFSDFTSESEYAESVFLLYDIGVLSGNSDGTFAGDRPLNRAELSKLLLNAVVYTDLDDLGGCFEDLNAGAWYEIYVCNAKELGYVRGDGDSGLFRPSGTTNVAEALSALNMIFEWGVDTESAAVWYEPLFVEAGLQSILVDGLDPDTAITRAVFADILAKAVVNYDLEQEVFVGFTDYYEWVYANIDDYDDYLGDLMEEFYENGGEWSHNHGDEDDILALYKINGSDGLELIEGVDEADYRAIWEKFKSIFPREIRPTLKEFAIFSDGLEETLAYVQQASTSSKEWRIAIDHQDAYVDGLDDAEFVLTLIHEFGHLVTLHPAQVPPNESVYLNTLSDVEYEQLIDDCLPRYFTGEGCALAESYINVFYQTFWSGFGDEYEDILYIADDMEYYTALEEFYEKYKDQFLNDYAATNPAEDIAESWTAFVLDDKPAGNSVAQEKVLFFYDYPEMLALRKVIRDAVSE